MVSRFCVGLVFFVVASVCVASILDLMPRVLELVSALQCSCLYSSLVLKISEEFEEVPVQSRSFGILDVGYRSKPWIVVPCESEHFYLPISKLSGSKCAFSDYPPPEQSWD